MCQKYKRNDKQKEVISILGERLHTSFRMILFNVLEELRDNRIFVECEGREGEKERKGGRERGWVTQFML